MSKNLIKAISLTLVSVMMLSLAGCTKPNGTMVTVAATEEQIDEELQEFGIVMNAGRSFRMINLSEGEKRVVNGPFAVITCPVGSEEHYRLVECPEGDDISDDIRNNWTTDYAAAKTILLISYTRTEVDVTTYSNGGQISNTFYNVMVKVVHIEDEHNKYYLNALLMNEKESDIMASLPDAVSTFLCDECTIE